LVARDPAGDRGAIDRELSLLWCIPLHRSSWVCSRRHGQVHVCIACRRIHTQRASRQGVVQVAHALRRRTPRLARSQALFTHDVGRPRLVSPIRVRRDWERVALHGSPSAGHLSVAVTALKKNPHRLSPVRVRFHQIKSLAVTYFHIDKVDTSIGAERFHFRVRKGIGWFPLAMAARQNGCREASHV